MSKNCNPVTNHPQELSELTLVSCNLDSDKKSYFLVFDGKRISIHSTKFLEDSLLDSPFSDPNEGLFVLNSDGRFGISGFIEDDFLVSDFWRSDVQSSLQIRSNLPTLHETRKEEMDYFVVSFPMYNLPLQLFIVSPKELVLVPIKDSLKRIFLFPCLY